jgi:molecular chaperone GrpE
VSNETRKQEQDQELTETREDATESANPTQQTRAPDGLDEEEGASGVDPNISAQMEALKTENKQLRDSVLRAQAETQNVRRRAEGDVEKARKYALEKFVNELLPVVDNLERTLDAADNEGDSKKDLIEGVKLTLKSLQDTLKNFGVELVNPQDEPFNPQLHQAISTIPNPDVEPNTVLNVFQKGYTLNGRLVRPAMVVVSNASLDTTK